MKKAKETLRVDPEFEALIPPLTTQESADLRDAIKREGRALDPIKTWQGLVVDGHNRFRICRDLELPFETHELQGLQDRAAVKAWMLQHQRGRRNMTRDQMLVLHLMHGAEPPPYTSPLAVADAKQAIAAGLGHDVLSNRYTLKMAVNKLNPRRPRTSATEPIAAGSTEPRTADTIAAEARARAQVSAAKADVRELSERVLQLEGAVAFMHEPPCVPPRIDTPRSRPKSGQHTATPVFVISDTHFGETVTAEESLGANVYDLEIAAQRMRTCWQNMLWLRADMARTNTCDDTLIILNGDIVSGDIHDELRETNDGGLRDQCDAAYAALLPGLEAFAEATPGVLHVVCIGGNHGRLTHKQQIKNGTQHSAEHLGVYDPLRRKLGDMGGKLAWHIPRGERHVIDVHGRRVSSQHGTMIRSQGGIGGVLVPMTRWVTRANDADLFVFGHFHEADAYGKIIKNGALIGASAYTKWLGVEDRPPEQVAFLVSATHGVRRFERVSVT